MTMLEAFVPYLSVVAAALLVWTLLKRPKQPTLPTPPGPRPLPLIGNILDFPTEKEWLCFRQWNEKYGDIVYTEALGKGIVILGSAEAVNDLLECKGAIYSDRPHMVMTHDLMDCKWSLPIVPYGDRWRKGRKLMHTHMHAGAASTFHPIQITAARQLVIDLLSAPQQPSTLSRTVRWNIGQMITKCVYGIEVKDTENTFISMAEQLLKLLDESMMPGRFLVDFIPALRHIPAWVPGAGFHTFGRKAAVLSRNIRDVPAAIVKANMADGTAATSMIRSMLEDRRLRHTSTDSIADSADVGNEDIEDELIKDIAAVTYAAGVDTTVSSIVSFFLAMLVYPEVQSKAQAEIDHVIGHERLPDMDDMPSLPYVNAVVTECLRWLPVAPMGIPHMTTADDQYKGYFIPKGTTVIGSVWAILHHPDQYPNPEVFSPERYLTTKPSGAYSSNLQAPDPRMAAFGFGRRVCPGRYVADASLFVSVATALATVNILRAQDAQGKEIIPEVAQSSGLASHPKPFEYSLEPRSEKSRVLLAATL